VCVMCSAVCRLCAHTWEQCAVCVVCPAECRLCAHTFQQCVVAHTHRSKVLCEWCALQCAGYVPTHGSSVLGVVWPTLCSTR